MACTKHPEVEQQIICDTETCPKCSEEYFLTAPMPKGEKKPDPDLTYGWCGHYPHFIGYPEAERRF